MMLPLSTIEGQETEEVQTRPPEKGGETREGRNLWHAGVGRSPGTGNGEAWTLKTGPITKCLHWLFWAGTPRMRPP